MRDAWRTIAAFILLCMAAFAAAQDYPNRPIRLVVPQPPGGPTDIVARLVAQKLSERLGQQVIVDNRPGAGSNIGTDIVAKAPKDGYTLVVGTVQHIVNPFLFSSLPFDAVKDFTPVTLMTKAHIVLVVNPELPVQSVKELIAYAKSKPGGISWASAGNGSTSHLALGTALRTSHSALRTALAHPRTPHIPRLSPVSLHSRSTGRFHPPFRPIRHFLVSRPAAVA